MILKWLEAVRLNITIPPHKQVFFSLSLKPLSAAEAAAAMEPIYSTICPLCGNIWLLYY